MNPSASIVAVAIVQFFGSLPFLYICGISLFGAVFVTHEFSNPPFLVVVLGFPVLFSLLSLVTSIGLLFLKEWARRATMFLSTVPVLGCGLLLLVRPASILPMTVGSGLLVAIYLYLLVILVPISAWWLILFTRAGVKTQFQSGKAAASP